MCESVCEGDGYVGSNERVLCCDVDFLECGVVDDRLVCLQSSLEIPIYSTITPTLPTLTPWHTLAITYQEVYNAVSVCKSENQVA